MKKILVATSKPFASQAVTQIESIAGKSGYQIVKLESYSDQSDLVAAVAEPDALIIRSDKVTAEVLAAANNLKVVVRAGAGYDNVDLEAARQKGVVVMNTPGQNSNAVAELALGMMVYAARNKFNGKPGTELKGKKLGIHAYGNVGKLVARIAKGFGMEVHAFDPFIDKDIIENDGVVCLNTVEELYSTCQYISLNIPVTDQTRGSINFDILNKMPQGATLVNTARKEVICEESLEKLLGQREDFRYFSDIAPDNHLKLAELFPERIFFTPKKMGAQTAEANINAGIAAVEQIIAFFESGDLTFKVN